MNETVSIIVPVYKVEAYLDECVVSLVEQTCKDIEILLIDDASPDSCPQMCDAWAKNDSRIRVIHKENGGAASARNAGLDAAMGAYICFVDSDDVVEPTFVEQLLVALRRSDADIAVCGFELWSRKTSQIAAGLTEPGTYSCQDYLRRFLSDWSCSLIWNKLYRREAVGDLKMEEGHRVDDEFFTYQVAMRSNCVAVCGHVLYRYRLRASSVMQDMVDVKEKVMIDRILYITTRYQKISKQFPDLGGAFFEDALDTLVRYQYHSKGMSRAQKMLRRWVWNNSLQILKMKHPLKKKMAFLYYLTVRKPRYTGEANSLERQEEDYFC